MQVHHDEGVANRIDPELCADTREGIGEALRERIGQPLKSLGLRRSPKMTPTTGSDVLLTVPAEPISAHCICRYDAHRGGTDMTRRQFLGVVGDCNAV